MSSIQEKTLDEVEQFLLAIFGTSVGVISDVGKFGVELAIAAKKKNAEKKRLISEGGELSLKKFQECLGRGESVLSIRVEDSMVMDCKRFLKEEKKIYMVMDDMEEDNKIFLFRGRDRDAMERIQKLLRVLKYEQGEVPSELFLKSHSGQDIATVSGLDETTAELFRYHMKSDPALFSVVRQEEGKYTILHKPEDSEKIRKAIHHANWNLNDPLREQIKEQVAFRLRGRADVAASFEDGEKEFYIVSKGNPKNFVHVTEHEISYYKNEKKIDSETIPRDHPHFTEKAWGLFEKVSEPVIFQPEEFVRDIGKRQEILDSKRSLEVFPEEYIVHEEQQKYNDLMHLVARKMSIDNENQGNWSLYDTSVSYSEYNGREGIMDMDATESEARKREFERMKEAYKQAEQCYPREVIVAEGGLDYMIQKVTAQLKNKNRGAQEIERTETYEKQYS